MDPTIVGMSARFFTSVRADTYRCVRAAEKDMLAVPWGPTIDVIFAPKNAPGIVGGAVVIMARTAGAEVEIARATIVDPTAPVALSASRGCDEYVIRAHLGADPGAMARRVDSYVYARVYSGL